MPWIAAAGAVVAGALGANAASDAAEASADATREATEENRRQYDQARQDTQLSRSVGQGALYRLADIFGTGAPDQAALSRLERSRERVEGILSGPTPNQDDLFAAGFTSEAAWRKHWSDKLNNVESRIQSISRPTGGGTPGGLYSNLEMDPGYEFRLAEGEKALQRQQSAGGTRYGGAALKAAARYGQDYSSNEFSNAVNRRNAELGYLFSLAGFGEQGIATAGNAGANAAANNSSILMQNAANQGNYGMQGASAINNAVQGGLQNYYTHQMLRNYNQPMTQTSTSNSGTWA